MERKKSAKDIAFEKEREKWRHQQNELQQYINELKREMAIVRSVSEKTIAQDARQIYELQEENATLRNTIVELTHKKLTPEEIDLFIEKTKLELQLKEQSQRIFQMMGMAPRIL